MARNSQRIKRFLGTIRDVDIRHLRVFQAIVERGGITAAEADLNVGRSTISIHIADLEKRLGMILCERGRGRFRLTEQGEIVYEATLELFGAMERFRGQVNAAHNYMAGDLSLGYMDQLSSHPEFRLIDGLRRFHEVAPKVRVTLRVTSLDAIEREVLEENLDVGIIAAYRQLPGLEYRDFIVEDQGLFCGVGHPLFRRPDSAIQLNHIAACDHVALGYVDQANFLREDLNVRPVAIAYSAEAVAHLVLTGHYVGVLPAHYADQWTRQGIMRALLPREFSFRRDLKIILRSGTGSSRVIGQFLEELFQAHGM